MTIRFVLRALALAVGLATAAASPLAAKPYAFKPGSPVSQIEVPQGWTTLPSPRGVELRSGDEEVFVWFEFYTPADESKVFKEHETYFTQQGVAITGEPKSSTSTEDGVAITGTDVPSTWKGKPTVLRYVAIDLGAKADKRILITVWASPEGAKAQHEVIGGLIGSFKLR